MNNSQYEKALEELDIARSKNVLAPGYVRDLVTAGLYNLEDNRDKMYSALERWFDEVLAIIKNNDNGMCGGRHITDYAKHDIAFTLNLLELYWNFEFGTVGELNNDRKKVADGKREDYTKGDEDVLKNFKNQAEAFGIDPKVSLGVHMEKQMSAVLNYIKTDGESESEPIIKRVGDTMNYLELLWGIISEQKSNTLYIDIGGDIHWGADVDDPTDCSKKGTHLCQTEICAVCGFNYDTSHQRDRQCPLPDCCPYE